ncbi:MAG: aminoacetone oxidase family FAD-binding enzyme [Lachnospiraceae bacterium]|nr:aminoacetone oxidase family FAD-binding enzyme [Lachnospiraceae bacterium]
MGKKILIVGGGAAGMMCAALLGDDTTMRVTLVDHNEKLGKKLFITGKGRCNFTNACEAEEFLNHVLTNPKFLYSALYTLDSDRVIGLFESWGMKTKVERGRRAFPASDHSSDVIDALRRQLVKNHVDIRLHTDCRVLLQDESTGRVIGAVLFPAENGSLPARGEVVHENAALQKGPSVFQLHRENAEDRAAVEAAFPGGEIFEADAVVVATGGISYPSTGSTGDGYRFARDLGLRVTKLYPSLVPVTCEEDYIREMQGLSLKNVELHVKNGKKEIFDEFGEMMFTHFGVTGPLILSLSAKIGPLIGKKPLRTWIDLKPAVTEEEFSERLVGIFEKNPNKALKNVLGEVYPARMVEVLPEVAGIDVDTKCHDITKGQRLMLVQVTKRFPMTMTALRGYNEAVVTKGGVAVGAIDPGTMAVKKVPGLYMIGEVLDVDAYTGGYNLQIAWSTAAVAAAVLKDL